MEGNRLRREAARAALRVGGCLLVALAITWVLLSSIVPGVFIRLGAASRVQGEPALVGVQDYIGALAASLIAAMLVVGLGAMTASWAWRIREDRAQDEPTPRA